MGALADRPQAVIVLALVPARPPTSQSHWVTSRPAPISAKVLCLDSFRPL